MVIVIILEVMFLIIGILAMVIVTEIMAEISKGVVVIQELLEMVEEAKFKIRIPPSPLRQLKWLKVLAIMYMLQRDLLDGRVS